jgi:hypothetical protein
VPSVTDDAVSGSTPFDTRRRFGTSIADETPLSNSFVCYTAIGYRKWSLTCLKQVEPPCSQNNNRRRFGVISRGARRPTSIRYSNTTLPRGFPMRELGSVNIFMPQTANS